MTVQVYCVLCVLGNIWGFGLGLDLEFWRSWSQKVWSWSRRAWSRSWSRMARSLSWSQSRTLRPRLHHWSEVRLILSIIHNLMNIRDVWNPIKLVYSTKLERHGGHYFTKVDLHINNNDLSHDDVLENFAPRLLHICVYCARNQFTRMTLFRAFLIFHGDNY